MDPVFKLKLCYPDGKALVFKGDSTFERNLVNSITGAVTNTVAPALVTAIMSRGVGFWRTEAHVKLDIENALADVLARTVDEAVKKVLFDLKAESVKAL